MQFDLSAVDALVALVSTKLCGVAMAYDIAYLASNSVPLWKSKGCDSELSHADSVPERPSSPCLRAAATVSAQAENIARGYRQSRFEEEDKDIWKEKGRNRLVIFTPEVRHWACW